MLRPVSRMIIKIISTKHLKGEIEFTLAEIDAYKNQFYKQILTQVDSMLDNSNYLCTSAHMSIVDLAFYNEISTVMYIEGNKMFKGDYPNLYKWLKRLS